MKKLSRIILVQFFLHEAVELPISGHVAFLGVNGSGKTAILDAVQIAMTGGHQNYVAFNSQSVSASPGGHHQPRSIRDYLLGVVVSDGGKAGRRREDALCYLTLVFEDDTTGVPVSIGVCIRASEKEPSHETLGMYVLPGVALSLGDHLEQTEAGDMPLQWLDFRAGIRQSYQRRSETPYIGDQPTKYVGELLHALQPRAKAINERDYFRVFKKSIMLRGVESVDAFLRDFVIEPSFIDRRQASRQIEQFKQLTSLLQKVKRQTADLATLGHGYDEVFRLDRNAATYRAMAADYRVQAATDAVLINRDAVLDGFRNRRKLNTTLKTMAAALEDAARATAEAHAFYTAAPGVMVINTHKAAIATSQRALDNGVRTIEQQLSRVRSVVELIESRRLSPNQQSNAQSLSRKLAHQATLVSQKNLDHLEPVLDEAMTFLKGTAPVLEDGLSRATEAAVLADKALKTVLGQIRNAEKGGSLISPAVAHLVELLEANQGITSQPVCNLAEVTDPAWQRAIESFLGRNREALMVAGGRERDAIRLLRQLPERDNPSDGGIVQPKHLRAFRWDENDSRLVGNLLKGNDIAIAFLRSLFGKTVCVETEAELEDHPRALTKDGMLSANNMTRRLKMVDPARLVLGRGVSNDDQARLGREMSGAMDAERSAQENKSNYATGMKKLAGLGDLDYVWQSVVAAIESARQQAQAIKESEEIIAKVDQADSQARETDWNQKKAAEGRLRGDQQHTQRDHFENEGRLRGLIRERQGLRDQLDSAKSESEAVHQLEIDLSLIVQSKDAIEKHADREAEAIRLADQAEAQREKKAQNMLLALLKSDGILFEDDMKDWRIARVRVHEQRQSLMDTELVPREKEVERARIAAEEAFRNDIALKMHESIAKMKASISNLNKLLKYCPPFSNGERYKFHFEAKPSYAPLLKYIEAIGQGAEQQALFESGDAHTAIMALLDDSVKAPDGASEKGRVGQKGKEEVKDDPNPLDDYRNLFVFDLIIEREGAKAIPLSKRIGVGSNGEHRTPFYVIAGAAMAAAYRIESDRPTSGAGLILLDEAFYGMDGPNALAVSRFLGSIGLQMVMAAPDTDYAKLAPCLDSVYEVSRFDLDCFLDPIHVKEPTRRLLTSDMPSEHPDLLTTMVAQLQGAATP